MLSGIIEAAALHLVLPEPVEPVGAQLGVAHCVLDVLVPEVVLERAGIVACIRQGMAAAVP